MSREKLREYISECGKCGPIMEIGPLANPFVTAKDGKVYYADIRNKDDIFRVFLYNGKDYTRYGAKSPEDLYSMLVPIDFVVSKSYTEAVGEMRFAGIFSSHVIEHTYDIIQHLIELEECLVDGGHLIMALPDKRYGPDHFREVTPFRDALDVHLNGKKALARLAFDHMFSYYPTLNAKLFRDNKVSFMPVAANTELYRTAQEVYEMTKNNGEPDVHVWVFTHKSFIEFMRDCVRSGLLAYKLEYLSEPRNSGEINVVFKKEPKLRHDESERLREVLRLQKMLDDMDEVNLLDRLKIYCQSHDSVYIYGAGVIGKGVYSMLGSLNIPVEGFIVSDGQQKEDSLFGLPIHFLSENFKDKDNCAILVSMSSAYQVIPTLKEKGLSYFSLS